MSSNGRCYDQEESFKAEVENFFDTAPPLKDLPVISQKLKEFIEHNSHASGNEASKRKIVCITSGGTTVPLEQRCVRYIDNFSSGFEELHQQSTFSRLDMLLSFSTGEEPASHTADLFLMTRFLNVLNQLMTQSKSQAEAVKKAVSNHHTAVKTGVLLKLQFTTIFEYLQLLQMIAGELRDLGPRVMFYLAAAVSDFYVPWESMAEHKIQSAAGPLDMRLAQVPKMLAVLRKDWAPQAFFISFKLETDSLILLDKASSALSKYKMHAVVANELANRKEEVTVVTPHGKTCIRREAWTDVEIPLIELLSEKHSAHIEGTLQN